MVLYQTADSMYSDTVMKQIYKILTVEALSVKDFTIGNYKAGHNFQILQHKQNIINLGSQEGGGNIGEQWQNFTSTIGSGNNHDFLTTVT